MGSAVFALKAHDDKVLEVRDAGLAHFHLTGYFARVAWNLKDDRLLFHEVVFFERFGEIYFCSDSFCLDLLNFLLGILFAVSHGNQFL